MGLPLAPRVIAARDINSTFCNQVIAALVKHAGWQRQTGIGEWMWIVQQLPTIKIEASIMDRMQLAKRIQSVLARNRIDHAPRLECNADEMEILRQIEATSGGKLWTR